MFGSSGLQPDPVNSLFGKFKKNNTPHEFNIGGKRVECYFSPSDGVNSVIENTIKTAQHEAYINTMLITRDFLANAIVDRHNSGVDAKVIVNSEEQCTPNGNTIVVDILTKIGADFRENGEGAILHHKTLIVDQGHPDSDPLVLTGCHNWSSSADTYNDENTLIIHDATIANIYYQEFYERFKNGDIITSEPIVPVAKNDYASMKQGDTLQFNVLDNDEIPAEVNVELSWGPASGTASVENSGLVTYIPDPAFNGLDTIAYKVCAASNDSYCDSAKLIVLVEEPSSSFYPSVNQGMSIYPNPAQGKITVYFGSNLSGNRLIEIYDLSGKRVYRSTANFNMGQARISIPESLEKGVYILRIHDPAQPRQSRLILH
jgi:hypothetical protein